MKQVFNSSEVAHIWANQQQETGRNANNNFYFKGSTIYSYGSHFPIATINGNDVLFTMRSYSNTTAKHIIKARSAVSHKNFIYCYDVPTNLKYATTEHENNLRRWKTQIVALFDELGNKRNRDKEGRILSINRYINELNIYCSYFKIPVTDKELKGLIKIAGSDNFVLTAQLEKEKRIAANELKIKQAKGAFDKYIDLWKKCDNEAITAMPDKVKNLCNFYANNANHYTYLRLNTGLNRLETSKGVQIPIEVAKRAYIKLNGCMKHDCKDLDIPVMDYTITESTKDSIIAGCHNIPKTDINYIAQLLKW